MLPETENLAQILWTLLLFSLKAILVCDDKLLNALTDISEDHFQFSPVQVLFPRIKGKFFSTRDLYTSYHQVPLTTGTQKWVHFVVGVDQYN